MKSKSPKKLTLAKETLKLLNANDLAGVQGGSDDTSPTLDPTCLPPTGGGGSSSDSL